MPLYFYVVRNQKVRFPVRVVVALPQGIVKVRFKTLLASGPLGVVCTYSGNWEDVDFYVDRVMALYWKSDGTLITQTTVTVNDTDIDVPSDAAYVEWRISPGAIFKTSGIKSAVGRVASYSRTVTVMGFIDQAGNITNIDINLVFICSGWDSPVTVASSTLPINIDIPFCHDCGGDFAPRQMLRGIYATIKSSQNAKLQAVLLDANKGVLASCPEQAVGDISSDTEIWLCPDNDPDLVSYLKVNYLDTRYIRVKIDKSNPAGPLPAAIFTIYFSLDKGSIP